MRYDLDLQGLSILLVLSLGFGLIAQLVGDPRTRWQWLTAGIGWFVGGLYMSEVLFKDYTIDEIQPIIGGLAFDEALLGGLIVGSIAVLATRFATGARPFHRPALP